MINHIILGYNFLTSTMKIERYKYKLFVSSPLSFHEIKFSTFVPWDSWKSELAEVIFVMMDVYIQSKMPQNQQT